MRDFFSEVMNRLPALSTDQLAELNNEAARLWTEKQAAASQQFRKGDKVWFFDPMNVKRCGTILRRGRKTCKIDVDGTTWRVSPSQIRS